MFEGLGLRYASEEMKGGRELCIVTVAQDWRVMDKLPRSTLRRVRRIDQWDGLCNIYIEINPVCFRWLFRRLRRRLRQE